MMEITINNRIKGTIKQKQDIILANNSLLYLGDPFKKPKKQTLERFIYMFFKSYNNQYHSYKVGTPTLPYKYQCHYGKRRSLIDTYLICKHYYPDCTLKEVKDIVQNRLQIHSTIC